MKTMTPDTQTELREPASAETETRRAKPGLVVVVVAMLVLALAGVAVATQDRGPSPAAVGSTDSTQAPVTLVPEAPVSPAVAPPTDFLAVVTGIVQIANDLRVHPNPARLSEYMESANPAYGDALSGQSQLVTGALRYDPAPTTPTVGGVKVLSRDGDSVLLSVTFDSLPRYRVVDRQGQVVSDSAASAGTVQWRLHLSAGTWRLVGAQSI